MSDEAITQACDLGVGCDESGVCYAIAHGSPKMCGRPNFEREDRYIVIKRKNLAALDECVIYDTLEKLGVHEIKCVVVEADWPEYETVWQMIEARCTGQFPWDDKSAAVEIAHAIGMSAEDFTAVGDEIVEALARYRIAAPSPDIQVSDLVSALKATTHEVEAMIPCVYHDITRDSMQAVADNARAALASFQEDDNG